MKIQEITPNAPASWRRLLLALKMAGVARQHPNNSYTLHVTDDSGPKIWEMLGLMIDGKPWRWSQRYADFVGHDVVLDPAARTAVGPNGDVVKSLPDLHENNEKDFDNHLPQWQEILDTLTEKGVARQHNNIYTLHLTDLSGRRIWKMLGLIIDGQPWEWSKPDQERLADFVVLDPAARTAVVVGPNGRGDAVVQWITDTGPSPAMAPVIESLSETFQELVKKLVDPRFQDPEDLQAWAANNLHRPWGFGFGHRPQQGVIQQP